MPYTFEEHLHNYAVWTAARAVQRAFTSTRNIKEAIEAADLRSFAESPVDLTEQEFEAFHREAANWIMDSLRTNLVANATYGRAAKIIAIYLKTAVILPSRGACTRSRIFHPPIDGILLNNLSADPENPNLVHRPWTQLSEHDYWNLVGQIKALKSFDWTLEAYWHPEREK
jgi:hypothetical protein